MPLTWPFTDRSYVGCRPITPLTATVTATRSDASARRSHDGLGKSGPVGRLRRTLERLNPTLAWRPVGGASVRGRPSGLQDAPRRHSDRPTGGPWPRRPLRPQPPTPPGRHLTAPTRHRTTPAAHDAERSRTSGRRRLTK